MEQNDDKHNSIAGIGVSKIRDAVFIISTIVALVAGWYTMKTQIDLISSQLRVVEKELIEISALVKEVSTRSTENDARIRVLERLGRN